MLLLRSSIVSAVSLTAAVVCGMNFHSLPAAFPPKTLAIACATLLASVATAARICATLLSTGRKTVLIVRTAWPNCCLMFPKVLLSCFMRPVGVEASAWFMPPTDCSTIRASVAARSASSPNLRMCSSASLK